MHTPGFTFLKLLRLRRAKSRADSRLVRTMGGIADTSATDKDHWFDISIRKLTWATFATNLATLPPILG